MGMHGSPDTSPKVIASLQREIAATFARAGGDRPNQQLGMVMEENGTGNYVACIKAYMERYAHLVKKLGLVETK